jgi:hypothetical protein
MPIMGLEHVLTTILGEMSWRRIFTSFASTAHDSISSDTCTRTRTRTRTRTCAQHAHHMHGKQACVVSVHVSCLCHE